MPSVGPYQALLDRFTDHLRVVRNLAPSTVSNSRHDVACFLDWWLRVHPEAELEAVRARHLADHLVEDQVQITHQDLRSSSARNSSVEPPMGWVATEAMAAVPMPARR